MSDQKTYYGLTTAQLYTQTKYSYNLVIVLDQPGLSINLPRHLVVAGSVACVWSDLAGLSVLTDPNFTPVNYGFVDGLNTNISATIKGEESSVSGRRAASGVVCSVSQVFWNGPIEFIIAAPKGFKPYGWMWGRGTRYNNFTTGFTEGETIQHTLSSVVSTSAPMVALVPILIKCLVITFDANGGTGAPDPIEVEVDGRWTCPTEEPTKEGWLFIGWGLEKTSEVPTYFSGAEYPAPDDDLTLFAVWQKAQGIVVFNPMGGEVKPSHRVLLIGDPIGSLPTPERERYSFLGWYDADGNPATSEIVIPDDGFVEIFARWSIEALFDPTKWSIRFIDPTGTNAVATRVFDVGADAKMPWVNSGLGWVAPRGFTVRQDALWSTNPHVRATIPNGGKVKDLAGPAETITLFAIWQAVGVTVNFDANGGTVDEPTRTVTSGTAIGRLPVPILNGRHFAGWFTEKEGGDEVVFTTKVTASLTVYAHWEAIPTFDWWEIKTF